MFKDDRISNAALPTGVSFAYNMVSFLHSSVTKALLRINEEKG